MNATTQKTLTSEQAAQVEKYVAAGTDRETAIRVVTAKGRKPAALKGNLSSTNNQGFSLLR